MFLGEGMKVLLLVDIQNDFCPGGNLAVEQGDQVVAVANQLIASGIYDLVIASKDWHPSNHSSFASNNLNGPWPDHCIQGSFGAEFHPQLASDKIDQVIIKGTKVEIDSYSAFFDNAKLNQTELDSFLKNVAKRLQISPRDIEVSVCGLALDYCVKATALDAVELGYKTELILDATRAVNINPGDDLKALRELTASGVAIVQSRSILPGIEQATGREINLSA